MNDAVVKAALAVAGVLIGWSGTALTLTGRVEAIEKTLVRIEARLDGRQVQPKPEPPK